VFELQTERLRLVALDLENLRSSLEAPQQMHRNLDLAGNAVLAAEVKEAVQQMLAGVQMDPENWLWHTNWQIVLKSENRIIGGFCFKGPADENGEVEVGYGTDPKYQGQGYMSEALREIARWALEQPGILAVISETAKSNVASQRVLQQVGFAPYQETEEHLWWRICRR